MIRTLFAATLVFASTFTPASAMGIAAAGRAIGTVAAGPAVGNTGTGNGISRLPNINVETVRRNFTFASASLTWTGVGALFAGAVTMAHAAAGSIYDCACK